MKTIQFFWVLLASSTLQAQTLNQATAITNQLPARNIVGHFISEQGANSRVWQKIIRTVDDQGNTVLETNQAYVELASGLNHLVRGQWVASKEEIDLAPDGSSAAATNGQHQVYFPGNIYNGVIKLVTPDGKILRSQPVGLSYFDGNNSVLIAELKDSTGALVGSNQIVYPDAFTDFKADLRYTYTRGSFEQDVILRQQPPDPTSLGLNPQTTRLQVLTEFFNPPQPSITAMTRSTDAGNLEDDNLSFGATWMGQGRAFLLGANSPSTVVNKRWLKLNGRQFLVEEVPVVSLANELDTLPPATPQANTGTTKHIVSKNQVLPPLRLVRVPSKPVQMAQAAMPSRGLVLDYQTLSGTFNPYTFQGDTTYYISGPVSLFGTITFEGGTVIKYAVGADILLVPGGSTLNWQASAYRPVIFTAKDDDSVGDKISGSTGNPANNFYAYPALSIPGTGSTTYQLQYLRIAYARQGIYTPIAHLILSDAQFVNCQVGIWAASTQVTVKNALFANTLTNLVTGGGVTFNAQNVTFSGSICLNSAPSSPTGSSLRVTNCILADVIFVTDGALSYDGDYNGFFDVNPFGSDPILPNYSIYPFQTVGAGDYYLSDGCGFLNVGTANIDPTLLADLRTKTTHPPMIYSNIMVFTNVTLNPRVQRDTNDMPDLGYHYDPIDYIVVGYGFQWSTLTLTNGVALADYNDLGVYLGDHSAIVSIGTPKLPNWFVRYSSVQEQSVLFGNPSSGFDVNNYHESSAPNGWFRFTKFACPAGGGIHLYDVSDSYSYTNLWVQDCEFWNGSSTFAGYRYTYITLKNNLFARSIFYTHAVSISHIFLTNNLFWGVSSVNFLPLGTANWSAYDNAFDSCTITANGQATANGYNAFLNCNGRLNPNSAGDIVLSSSLAYQPGTLGTFYQPISNNQLINGGSPRADQVGLYHYTVTTDQVVDGMNPVSIGYHYVAVDTTSGNPLDTDGDGLPDYVEDSNGNGVYDAGDVSDWQNPFTDGSGMDDGWEVKYFGHINIDPYADPDGDGYDNLEEYQNGTDPTVFNSPPNAVTSIQVLHDSVNPANVDITWQAVSSATSYTITRTIGNTVTTYTVAQGTTSWTDFFVPAGSSPTYTVTPNYSGGGNPNPSPTGNPDYNPSLVYNPEIVRGPTPSDPSLTPLQIVLGGPVPAGVSAIRVYKWTEPLYYSREDLGDDPYAGPFNYWNYDLYWGDLGWNLGGNNYDGYFDVPISQFVNGIYQIKKSDVPEWCAYGFETQPRGSDNRGGVINYAIFARNVPFMDGSAVLKDNLRFILRAGQTGNPNAADIALISFQANNNYAAVSPYIEHVNVGQDFLTEVAAFNENWFMRNWAYDTGFASFDYYGPSYYFFWWDKDIAQPLFPWYGYQSVGVNPAGGRNPYDVKYQFDGHDFLDNGNTSLLNSQLTGNPFIYLGDGYPADIGSGYNGPAYYAGLSWDGSQTHLASGYANYFGLPYQSVRVTDSLNPLNPQYQHDIPAGGAYSDPDPYYYSEYFQNVTPPTLTTVSSADYYFTQISDLTSPYAATIYPKPNDPSFSVDQTTPLIITAVGQPTGILGWAKQSISVNGNAVPGKFGYLGQYFDPTSVSGAILSEYGDFFPMQPGQFTLKTKADGGQQGQCTVYAISLNVDANHDNYMDLTYGGPDTTSATTPMEFWINNDNDGTGVGEDSPVLGKKTPPDYTNTQIRSQRDLEDFARLWISGMPSIVTGYQIILHWRNYGGSHPAIKLFLDQLAGGGTSYLTDPGMARSIVDNPNSEFNYCTVSAGTDFVFPDPAFFNGSTKHFLFEGVSPGRGELVMTISQNGNTIAETSVWLDLHDVKDFYERAVIADNTSGAISTWSSTINSIEPALASALGNDQNLIVFVHGINVHNVDWLIDSDTVFKRLYWSGYKGKFATVDWPCNFFDWSLLQSQTSVFNQSEIKAYKAGTALASYLTQLRAEFPGYRLHLFVHSQGNAVVSEAIEQSGVQFDTYILTQGAMPDSAYDVNATEDSTLTTAESVYPTPQVEPMGYHGIYANFTGRIVNFYNTFDPVLSWWITDQAGGKPDSLAQKLLFPALPITYYTFDGVNGWHHNIFGIADYQVTDSQESRAMISRSLTDPIGRSGPASAHGVIQSAVDLNSQYGFYNSFPGDHSAQWVWPIQTTRPYFQQVLISCQIQPAP